MTASPPDFRCSGASLADAEPMAGTAPTEVAWLLVEYAGPWGRQAVAESRLPVAVKERLAALTGVRVQLIRRHGGVSGPGVRVFAAWLGEQPAVRSAVLDDHNGLLDLDLTSLAEGGDAGLAPYDGALLLVCTNGRRDVCCAELGRPIASALAARWPEATWETTHLGGHRFAGTLLELPSGVTLGRLDVESAVGDCTALTDGRFPVEHARGRAGRAPRAQVAELHLRTELGIEDLDATRTGAVDGDLVRIDAAGADFSVEVRRSEGVPRRQSCSGLDAKSAGVYEVISWGREESAPPASPSERGTGVAAG